MMLLPSAHALSAIPTVLPCCVQPLSQLRCRTWQHTSRRSRKQVLCSTGPESVPVQTISLLDAQNQAHNNLSPSELRKVWDNTGKPLLRVGKTGLQASHKRSLQELLLAHSAVKVQINLLEQSDIDSAGQQLADSAGADLLQLKGRTALFAAGGKGRKELLPDGAVSKALQGIWDQGPNGTRPVELAADVQTELQHLRYSGALGLHEPDSHCIKVLSQLPPATAIELLKLQQLRRAVNKSAWLTSQGRRRLAQQSRKDNR